MTDNNVKIEPIKIAPSFFMFLIPGIWFCIIIKIIVPYLSNVLGITAYIVWMFAGTFFLFAPLFLYTLLLLKRDGYKLNLAALSNRLKIKKLSLTDTVWVVVGMIVATILTGIIILIFLFISKSNNLDFLLKISPIKVSPLVGNERLFLLFLPTFFFFNYLGEEMLWRGYILPRQLASKYGKYACLLNALFHCVFHLAFGIKPLIMMFPFMFLFPYIAYKRNNTTTSLIMHFLLGAPSQVLITLGLLL